jgi:hypothetical protein
MLTELTCAKWTLNDLLCGTSQHHTALGEGILLTERQSES